MSDVILNCKECKDWVIFGNVFTNSRQTLTYIHAANTHNFVSNITIWMYSKCNELIECEGEREYYWEAYLSLIMKMCQQSVTFSNLFIPIQLSDTLLFFKI